MRFAWEILRIGAFASCAALVLAACSADPKDAETETEAEAEAELSGEEAEIGQPENTGSDPKTAAETDDMAAQVPAAKPVEMAETAWAANDDDGAIYTTFIDADGAYRDYRDGQPYQIGAWDMPGNNRLCFQPDNVRTEEDGRTCWTVSPPAEDGAMVALGADNSAVTIRQIEYAAPEFE